MNILFVDFSGMSRKYNYPLSWLSDNFCLEMG